MADIWRQWWGMAGVLVSTAAIAAAPQVLQGTLLGGVAGEPAGNDLLGFSVDLDGDTLIAGAFSDEIEVMGQGTLSNAGSVYVYRFDGQTWEFQQRLIAPDAQNGAFFGFDVAVSGDRLIVGAPLQDSPPPGGGSLLTDQGAAYVYRRIANMWMLEQTITPQQPMSAFAQFGWSVAIDGDTLAIAAPEFGEGIADVHVHGVVQWDLQQRVFRPSGSGFAGANAFGRAMALHQDSLLIGAPLEDNPPLSHGDAGAAYVFIRSAGTWSLQQRLVPLPAVVGAAFGSAVAIHGDQALIGSPDEPVQGLSSAGAAYHLLRAQGGLWSAPTRWTSVMPEQSARYGNRVAIEASCAAVGAYWTSGTLGMQEGRVHVYPDPGTGPALSQTLMAPPSTRAAFNQFGSDVAISGDRIAVGEPGYDRVSNNDGAVHVFAPDAAAIFADGFD